LNAFWPDCGNWRTDHDHRHPGGKHNESYSVTFFPYWPYWKDTAIFVLEDDSQNGPDHVDMHRSPAFVISAYNRRGDSYPEDRIVHLPAFDLMLVGLRQEEDEDKDEQEEHLEWRRDAKSRRALMVQRKFTKD
jgi:hypothetical protein